MDKKEIELKLHVPDLTEVATRLQALGYRLVVPAQAEISTLWDQNGQFRARGEAIRVRSYGGRTLLTWKGPREADPALKIRREAETEVADAASLEAILRALGLAPAMVMEKERALWEGSELEVCLDRTPFGCYVELEGAPEAIAAARTALDLDAAPVETLGYPFLFERHRTKH